MTDERPANTDEPQTPPPVATEPETPRDEQKAEEQNVEAGRRPRPKIALDHDP